MNISVLIGQFPITFNIHENLKEIKLILEKSQKDDLVVLPEGALSGYSDDITFLKDVNVEALKNAMKLLKEEVESREVHLIFGSCIFEEVLSDKLCYFKKEIELNQVSNWYIKQHRNDIVKLINGKALGDS